MAISVIPNFYYLATAPKDTYYAFANNYLPDYYQYISHMKDGADGKIMMIFRSSPDNFVRKPVYLFYTLAGFIISKLGIDLFMGFFLMRIIFCFLKFMVVYYLILCLFPKSPGLRKLSFFFVVFNTPFYSISPFQMIFSSITSIDSLVRTLFIPHDLVASALLILAAIFFDRWLKENGSLKDTFLSGIFFLTATITNPAMLTTFSLLFVFAVIVYFLKQKNSFKKIFIGSLVIGIIVLPVFVYYQFLFSTTLPFSLIFNNQKWINYNIGLREYILICGPILFLSVFAIPDFFSRKDFLSKMIITWGIFPFLLFQIYAKYLPLSHERIFESCFYIPLSILAAYSVCRFKSKVIKALMVVFFIAISVPYFYLSLTKQLTEYNGPYFNVFIPYSTIEAFNWLDKNSRDESVVTAGYFSGNLLMAFSHNKILFGHDHSAYKAKERWAETATIYSSGSSTQQIKEILDRENVSYILFAPDTFGFGQTNLASIKNLKLVFSNSSNAIYQYNK